MACRRRALLLSYLKLACLLRARRKRQHKWWVKPINSIESKKLGEYEVLFLSLVKDDRHLFHKYLRMSPERFDQLLQQIRPEIEKKDTQFRECIPAEKRLVITIRFLSRGIAQETLATSFRVGPTTVSNIVNETCKAIHKIMSPIYMSRPSTSEQWKSISAEFLG